MRANFHITKNGVLKRKRIRDGTVRDSLINAMA